MEKLKYENDELTDKTRPHEALQAEISASLEATRDICATTNALIAQLTLTRSFKGKTLHHTATLASFRTTLAG